MPVTTHFLKILIVPMIAILLGAMWFTVPMLEEGECAVYVGTAEGNASSTTSMKLCRYGDRLEGYTVSSGEGGLNIFQLGGTVNSEEWVQMKIDSVWYTAPKAGWLMCSDDVYAMRWDEKQQRLYGMYHSNECDDHARLSLMLDHKASQR